MDSLNSLANNYIMILKEEYDRLIKSETTLDFIREMHIRNNKSYIMDDVMNVIFGKEGE